MSRADHFGAGAFEMCGRYTMAGPREAFEGHFGVAFPETGPCNVAPSQDVPVIRDAASTMRWGLVPAWSKEPRVNFSNINDRAETVTTSASFRAAKARRCLMPADGFYEWGAGPPTVPHHFRLTWGEPFAFAGIWERWGESLETCALITTEASAVVGPVHGRMPVTLYPGDYATWLDPKAPPDDQHSLLRPFDGPLTATAVGRYINSPGREGPRCIEPD